jgi:hypothetical protein
LTDIAEWAGQQPSSPSLEQCLHVAATIGDDHDEHNLPTDAVNQPVRLNKDLPKLPNTERVEFLWHRSAQRKRLERLDGSQQAIEKHVSLLSGSVVFHIAVQHC